MAKNAHSAIHINILKPQGRPKQLPVNLIGWILSTGRYIIIIVEIVVLGAFVSRFKLDSDIANTREQIEQKIPIINSMKQEELLIRQTHLQLATVKENRKDSTDYLAIIEKIALQTPQTTIINSLNLQKNSGKIDVNITGETPVNTDISSLLVGLRSDTSFSGMNIVGVSIEETTIRFTITGTANITQTQ